MKLYYVFDEEPYAMALSTEYLTSRCSFCASGMKIEYECYGRCKRIVYCSESCRQKDRAYHENECSAIFLGNQPTKHESCDLEVRILGRIISRYQLDKGVVQLSPDFPRHMFKDRCFDDMMTHDRELRHSIEHEQSFQEVKKAFYKFFKGTKLRTIQCSLLRKFFYRLCINGFSLNVRIKPQADTGDELGEVIYLNASRFNHSCRPTCLYKFDGHKIVIEYIDYAGKEIGTGTSSDSIKKIELNKHDFDNLTLQYGFGSYWNYGTSCPTTIQRRQSLKSRYFFRCQCVLCADKIRNELQLNAASIECQQCQTPYVWRSSMWLKSMKMKKICRCPKAKKTGEKKDIKIIFEKGQTALIKHLDQQWKKVMENSATSKNPYDVIDAAKPLLIMAKQFWHPIYNLRLGQLNEKVFSAWCQMTVDDEWLQFYGSERDLDTMLKSGEDFLKVYSFYFEPYMLPIAGFAVDVATLYKLRSDSPDDIERAKFWYQWAIDAWNDRREFECAQFIEDRAQAAPLIWKTKV